MSVLIKSKLTDKEVSFILPVETLQEDLMDSNDAVQVEETAKTEADANDFRVNEEILNEISHEPLQEVSAGEENKPSYNEEELEALKQTTKEEAYRAGYQEALDDVKAQYANKLDVLDAIAESLRESAEQYLQQSEPIIAAIVFSTVCKIIGEVLADEKKSSELVRKALQELNDDEIREVLVSQSDYDVIENLKNDFFTPNQNDGASFNQLKIIVDNSISLGGCKVKLPDGYLDATIQSQLNVLAKVLVEKADSMESKS